MVGQNVAHARDRSEIGVTKSTLKVRLRRGAPMKPSHAQHVAASIRSSIRYCFFAASVGGAVYFATLVYLHEVSNIPNPAFSDVYHAGVWVWLALLSLHGAFKYGERCGRFGAKLDRQKKETGAATEHERLNRISMDGTSKPGEAPIIMSDTELFDIAWLADYGLRTWTNPLNAGMRSGERLPKDRAEKLSSLLDSFERKIALSNWPSESKTHEETRFANYEDRMKRLWEYYG